MEELTQFVSKSFEDGNGGSSGEGWGAASSRSSVSPLVDPEDSRSEPPSSPAITRNTSPPPQAGRGTPAQSFRDFSAEEEPFIYFVREMEKLSGCETGGGFGELNCDVMAKTEENCEENLIALVQEEPLDLSIKRAAANVSPAPDQMKSNYENKINLRSKINSQKEKRSGMPPKKLKQQSKEPNARTTRDNTEASGTPMSVFQSQDFRTCTCLYCCILRLQLLNNFQPF